MLAKTDASEAKVDANLKDIKEDIKAKIEDSSEKFEVLQRTLVFRMDAH
jgi:DNA anti-recombination protein RmuC